MSYKSLIKIKTMKATEANQLAMDSCKDEIKKFLGMIKTVSIAGDTELLGTTGMMGGTKSYLENLGYHIELSHIEIAYGRRVLGLWKITWNKTE